MVSSRLQIMSRDVLKATNLRVRKPRKSPNGSRQCRMLFLTDVILMSGQHAIALIVCNFAQMSFTSRYPVGFDHYF